MNKRIKQFLLFIVAFGLSTEFLFAAETVTIDLNNVIKVISGITLAIILLVIWLALVYSEKNDVNGSAFKVFMTALIYKINPTPPIDKEQDIMLDHNYDGIKELNNVVPPWFNFLFYGTILAGIIYFFNFHIVDQKWSAVGEYKNEIKAASLQREILIKSGAFIDENTVVLANDAGTIQAGKEIFVKNCVSCHGANAEGLVGPNLTDEFWIHGGGIKNIFKTIKIGVPDKGMIAWQTQLTPKQMQEVANYIISLFGTNPPNPKAPQGNKWVATPDSTTVIKTPGI